MTDTHWMLLALSVSTLAAIVWALYERTRYSVVVLPPGDYRMNNPLEITDRVRFVGTEAVFQADEPLNALFKVVGKGSIHVDVAKVNMGTLAVIEEEKEEEE